MFECKSWFHEISIFKSSLSTPHPRVLLHARLITTASDARAADIFYHTDCYSQLRYAASKVNHSANSTSHGHAPPVFDSMVISQLVLYM